MLDYILWGHSLTYVLGLGTSNQSVPEKAIECMLPSFLAAD